MVTRATILVVENDADSAAPLRDALSVAGHRVLTADSAPAAIAVLRAFRVQLVIADGWASVSPADSRSSLETLLAAKGDAPFILCSASEPGEYGDHAPHGGVAFLQKPFGPATLLALVASLLPDAHRAAAERGSHALQQIV